MADTGDVRRPTFVPELVEQLRNQMGHLLVPSVISKTRYNYGAKNSKKEQNIVLCTVRDGGTVRPRLTAYIRFQQKYPDRRGNRVIEHAHGMYA